MYSYHVVICCLSILGCADVGFSDDEAAGMEPNAWCVPETKPKQLIQQKARKSSIDLVFWGGDMKTNLGQTWRPNLKATP